MGGRLLRGFKKAYKFSEQTVRRGQNALDKYDKWSERRQDRQLAKTKRALARERANLRLAKAKAELERLRRKKQGNHIWY